MVSFLNAPLSVYWIGAILFSVRCLIHSFMDNIRCGPSIYHANIIGLSINTSDSLIHEYYYLRLSRCGYVKFWCCLIRSNPRLRWFSWMQLWVFYQGVYRHQLTYIWNWLDLIQFYKVWQEYHAIDIVQQCIMQWLDFNILLLAVSETNKKTDESWFNSFNWLNCGWTTC